LRHFRHECSGGSAEERVYGAKMLEWVLGDEEHRQAYAEGIGVLKAIADDPESNEMVLRYALQTALRLLA